MPDAAGNSLVVVGAFGTFDLLGNPAYRITPGWDLGAPVPDVSTIIGLLLDGDLVVGNRSGNAQCQIPLLLMSTDRVTLAQNLNPLLQTVDCQPPNTRFDLVWTPAGGLPVVYTCFRGVPKRQRVLSVENANATVVTLTFPRLPFGRSDVPVSIAAVSPQLQVDALDTAPTGATLDTTNHYQGTGSAAVTLTRTSLGSGLYQYDSGAVSRTITAVDLSGYASIGLRVRWPAPSTARGSWTGLVRLSLGDGGPLQTVNIHATFVGGATNWQLLTVNLSKFFGVDLTHVVKWQVQFDSFDSAAFAAPPSTSTAQIDDLRAYPASSTAVSTTEGAVVTVPAVVGTARAPLSFSVTRGGSTLNNGALIHRPPVTQSLDAAILAALASNTVTIAAANNTFDGTYAVWLLIGTAGSGTRTVTVTFTHKQGATTIGTQTMTVTYAASTGKFLECGRVTLPVTGVPAENTSDTLVIAVSSTGGTADTFTDVALLDVTGQFAVVGAPPTGTTVLYFDAPTNGDLGQVYASATDRTAATSIRGQGNTRMGGGPMSVDPGDNRILVASPDGLPTLVANYTPCWLDERTA